MDLSFLARGVAIGFTVAVGVGPISLLTIRRTLAHGRAYGLASGLGVATADASYGGIAAFGLTAITAVLVGARTVLGLIGGIFLVWLGIRTLLAPVADQAAAVRERPGLIGAAVSIYGLTMTNPMTILSFGAIFAGLGLAGRSVAEAALLTLGVWLGSMAWWLILTTLLAAFRARVTPRVLLAITRASGVILLVFGVLALAVATGVA
ncbi:MAG TPA: LysE family transporter [Candidatus Limnocylindrales bacterium]|jgi:threonine/homoserine/homoserine lactone efflux protein|nr:LysE family transporter [Candidatus Limnocylindrales bacterium]